MRKRKDMSSPSSFPLKISEQKKSARRDELALIRWDILPTTLWLLATKYLTLQELVAVSRVGKMFINIFIERIIKSHKKEFPLISSFDPEQYTNYSIIAKLSLFNNYKEQYDLYFTLINRSYIPLFSILNKYDQEAAIQFVHSKLQSTSMEGNQENVTDMVFFQKNSEGYSAINIAQRFGLQDFLDYCFNHLILNGMDLNTGKYSLIRPGRYAEVLQGLETTGMSREALWMYGCAYVCDQKEICRVISSQPFWTKTWIDDSDHYSMVLVAALLSSVSLAKHILEGLDPKLQHDLLYTEPSYESKEIYYNTKSLICLPIDAAALSKNREFIGYLMSFSGIAIELLMSPDLYTFYIYFEDILGIREFFNSESDIYNPIVRIDHKYLNIDYEAHQLSVLGVAIARNWLPGVIELINYGFSLDSELNPDERFIVNPLGLAMYFGHIEIAKFLLNRGANVNGSEIAEYPEPSPIFNAIEEGRLDCVQLLVKYGVSLMIKSRTDDNDEYPLISAILEEEGEIIQYLIETLGRTQALHQLNEELLLRPESGNERKLIATVYDNLLKVAQPSGDVTFFSAGGEDSSKPGVSNSLYISKP